MTICLKADPRPLEAGLRRVHALVIRMNLHDRGQRLLNRTTASATGTGASVTYTRGATSVTLVATPTRENQDATVQPTPGTRSSDRERDYIIVFADLVAAGFNEPTLGDQITESLNGGAVVFEAAKLRTEPCWRWADVQRTRVRVHTRRKE